MQTTGFGRERRSFCLSLSLSFSSFFSHFRHSSFSSFAVLLSREERPLFIPTPRQRRSILYLTVSQDPFTTVLANQNALISRQSYERNRWNDDHEGVMTTITIIDNDYPRFSTARPKLENWAQDWKFAKATLTTGPKYHFPIEPLLSLFFIDGINVASWLLGRKKIVRIEETWKTFNTSPIVYNRNAYLVVKFDLVSKGSLFKKCWKLDIHCTRYFFLRNSSRLYNTNNGMTQ